MEISKWKNKVLGSFEGIQKAEPRRELFDDVWSNVQNDTSAARKVIPLNTLRLVAASILILIALNTYVIRDQWKSEDSPGMAIAESSEYLDLLTNYNIYE